MQKTKDYLELDLAENVTKDYLHVRIGEMTVEIDFGLKTVDIFGPENEALITLTDTKIKSIKRKKRDKDV